MKLVKKLAHICASTRITVKNFETIDSKAGGEYSIGILVAYVLYECKQCVLLLRKLITHLCYVLREGNTMSFQSKHTIIEMNRGDKVSTSTYQEFLVHGKTAQFLRNVVLGSLISILIKDIVTSIVNKVPGRMKIVVSVVRRIFPPCAGWAHIVWIIIKGAYFGFHIQGTLST